MPDSDPSATLEAIKERNKLVNSSDVPSLVAALEAALGFHVEAVIEDMPEPWFRYCKTCSGHPAWPCPEVAAITAALNGDTDA